MCHIRFILQKLIRTFSGCMQNPKIENSRFPSLKNHILFKKNQWKLAPGWNYQLRPRNRVQVAEIALDTLREVVWILCAVYGRVV